MKIAAFVMLMACGGARPPPAPEVPDTATPPVPSSAPVDGSVADAAVALDHPDGMVLGAELERIPPARGSMEDEREAGYAFSYVWTEGSDATFKVAVDSTIESIRPITRMQGREEDTGYLIRVADPVQVTVDSEPPVLRKDVLAREFMIEIPGATTVDLAKGQHVMLSIEERDPGDNAFARTVIKDDKGLVAAFDPPTDIVPHAIGKKMTDDRYEVTTKLGGKQLRSLYWSTQSVNGTSYFMYGVGTKQTNMLVLLRKPQSR